MKESEDEDESKKIVNEKDEQEDSNTVQKFKQALFSSIWNSHKSSVNDLKWIPKGVKVEKKQVMDGNFYFMATCSEDGIICIWDTWAVVKEIRAKNTSEGKETMWDPLIKIQLYRQDGSGEMGLTRLLFKADQTNALIYCASDEGDLMQIDWSVRPPGGEKKLGVIKA